MTTFRFPVANMSESESTLWTGAGSIGSDLLELYHFIAWTVGPPKRFVCWFINPFNYSYLHIINHCCWSSNQLSYRGRGPHFVAYFDLCCGLVELLGSCMSSVPMSSGMVIIQDAGPRRQLSWLNWLGSLGFVAVITIVRWDYKPTFFHWRAHIVVII